MNYSLKNLLPEIIKLAKQSGQAILEVYQSPEDVDIKIKSDTSPVTQADMIAHKLIKKGLLELTPDIPLLSEEGANIPYETRKTWQTYWLVDPLDGTKEFIHRTDEYTVNIALIYEHRSILGVIYAPVIDALYYAYQDGGAYRQYSKNSVEKIHTRHLNQQQLTVAVSRRHGTEHLHQFLNSLANFQVIRKGSSLKSCMVAEGSADIYPCLGPTSEWDMAAAHCIVNEAGGEIIDTNSQPLRYNMKPSLINPEILIVGDTNIDWQSYL